MPDNKDIMLSFEGHECEYGCCPICEFPEVEYIGREIVDETLMYPWKCTESRTIQAYLATLTSR